MAPETPNDPPAPVPEPPDGDGKEATAEVAAEVVAAPVPAPVPAKASSPAQEWGAAIVLMLLFAFICVAFMSFFRG